MRTTQKEAEVKTVEQYLAALGLDEREVTLYLTLAEIGLQPASIVAKRCNFDRVTTYKHLKKMVEIGLINTHYKSGIQHFTVAEFAEIRRLFKEREQQYSELLQSFPAMEQLLKARAVEKSYIPKLQIFEKESGIKQLLRDMFYIAKKENLRNIRMLTSNTFEEKLASETSLARYVAEFYTDLQKAKITLDVYEATGSLVPERITHSRQRKFDPSKLPATRSTTSIFLVGHTMYLASYGSSEVGLKIEHEQISQIFHFMFDFIGKNVSE